MLLPKHLEPTMFYHSDYHQSRNNNNLPNNPNLDYLLMPNLEELSQWINNLFRLVWVLVVWIGVSFSICPLCFSFLFPRWQIKKLLMLKNGSDLSSVIKNILESDPLRYPYVLDGAVFSFLFYANVNSLIGRVTFFLPSLTTAFLPFRDTTSP